MPPTSTQAAPADGVEVGGIGQADRNFPSALDAGNQDVDDAVDIAAAEAAVDKRDAVSARSGGVRKALLQRLDRVRIADSEDGRGDKEVSGEGEKGGQGDWEDEGAYNSGEGMALEDDQEVLGDERPGLAGEPHHDRPRIGTRRGPGSG